MASTGRTSLTHLACRIDYLRREVFPSVRDDFGKGVFDGGVVALDKVAIDILDRERGFAYDSALSDDLESMRVT